MKNLLFAVLVFAGCQKVLPVEEPGVAILDGDCDINWFWEGFCTFTNTGDAPGSICVHPKMLRLGDKEDLTPEICSGEIPPATSVTVPFEMQDLYGLCVDAEAEHLAYLMENYP
jgi:hypothetical protein